MRIDRQVLQTQNDDNLPLKISLTPGRMNEAEISALPPHVVDFLNTLNKEQKALFTFLVRPTRGFLDLVVVRDHGFGLRAGFNPMILEADRAARELLLNIIHIPGLRGNPARDYPKKKTKGPRFDGHFQEYVAGIVASWKETSFGQHRLRALSNALQELGLTWKVDAKSLDDTRVEILVGRLKSAKRGGAKDVVNIADVGFGVSQILPALVAIITAAENQMVFLEQPEIHLHPRAQKNLAGILAKAAKAKKCLVVETHSSILIRGIQTLVAKGELSPDLVKLHWFSQDEKTGATKVTSADLDENGAYGAEWPEDFDDTYLESERDYLDAVEARML
jgi:hypothetical protein